MSDFSGSRNIQAVYYVPNVPNVPTGSVDVLLSTDFKKMVPKVPIF
jgi:hypothetical protein